MVNVIASRREYTTCTEFLHSPSVVALALWKERSFPQPRNPLIRYHISTALCRASSLKRAVNLRLTCSPEIEASIRGKTLADRQAFDCANELCVGRAVCAQSWYTLERLNSGKRRQERQLVKEEKEQEKREGKRLVMRLVPLPARPCAFRRPAGSPSALVGHLAGVVLPVGLPSAILGFREKVEK